jgi:hypothetical protein
MRIWRAAPLKNTALAAGALAIDDQPLASQKKVRITHSLPPSL